jgi:hypothetical protein
VTTGGALTPPIVFVTAVGQHMPRIPHEGGPMQALCNLVKDYGQVVGRVLITVLFLK